MYKCFALITLLMLLLLACTPHATSTASDPVTQATITSDPGYLFLRQYGWSPQGKPKDDAFEIPRPIPKTPPIYLPLTASQAVGLGRVCKL